MQPYRSILFVPGHKPQWAEKAIHSGADCIVLDLEDSVPEHLKEGARETVVRTIVELRASGHTGGIFVRPNPIGGRFVGADLEAVVRPGLDGLFIPKVRNRDDVIRWETLLDWFETRNGAADCEFIVPIEMIDAIQNCREIAGASPRVGAMIGPTAEHADIARAVGYRWTPDGLETLYLRSRILLACREFGLHALTGLWEELGDLDGLRDFAEFGVQLGFRGQIAIHPSHVTTLNEVYSPSDADIEFRAGLIRAFEDGAAAGHGAVRYRGIHIDKAHADTAREWLEYAESVRSQGGSAIASPTSADTTEIKE